VNQVTPALFKKYPGPEAFACADPREVERAIHSTGFYRNKTRNIMGAAKEVIERFGGKVPSRMEDLVTIPGVGRKTANVILGNASDPRALDRYAYDPS
jgi:endonuclease-3